MVSDRYLVCPNHGRDCKDCAYWDGLIWAMEGDDAA